MILSKAKRAVIPVCLLAITVLFLVALDADISRAERHSVDDIRAAVETWVRHVTADARPDAAIEEMEPYIVDGEIVGYIAHLAGGGFCLCGTDDLVLPVYLYNPKGTYGPKIPGYQDILREIAVRTADLRAMPAKREAISPALQDVLTQRSFFWRYLIAGQLPARQEDDSGPTVMELDFTAKWHQGSPYNDQCPVLTPGTDEHCVVGCNATAAAQVMYYWKWPDTGAGTGQTTYNVRYRTDWDSQTLFSDPGIPLNWAGGNRLRWRRLAPYWVGFLQMNGYWDDSLRDGAKNDKNITHFDDASYQTALDTLYGRLTPQARVYWVNPGATTYNWSLMKDEHSDPPDAGDTEVAKLCYHVGVASESGYGFWGTGSCFSHPDPSHGDISGALRDNFRYDQDIYVYPSRNSSTIHYLAEEIQWLRPVLLGGSSPNGGGHAYVVYGYNTGTDPDRQFLMNMGWGPGNDHVWYSLDTTPFSLNQDHTIRIAPQNVVKFVGAANSGDGSPDDPYRDIEEAVTSAPSNAKLIFKANSFNTYSESEFVINRPFTMTGYNVEIGK